MARVGIFRKSPGIDYEAFFPEKFPPQDLVDWSDNFSNMLSMADMAIGRLSALDTLIPSVDFFISMYSSKEATISSQIEGTQATLVDYLEVQAGANLKTQKSDTGEIINHVKAMNHGLQKMDVLGLCWRLVREVHNILLQDVSGQEKTPGEFRRSQNWIGSPNGNIQNARFVPPPHHAIGEALSDLEKFFNKQSDSQNNLPILVKAGLIHAQFETIHPFLDGNGRIGRMLIILYLIKEEVLSKPVLYLSKYFKQNQQEYYDKLNGYRKGRVQDWLVFFLNGVKEVSDDGIEKAKKIMVLTDSDEKKISYFGRSVAKARKVLRSLYKLPITNSKAIGEIAKIKSSSNKHNLIQKFVNANILEEIGNNKKNKRYIHREYYELFKE